MNNLSEAGSVGSKGAIDKPSKPMAKPQGGAVEWLAGLRRKAPHMKQDTWRCLPNESST